MDSPTDFVVDTRALANLKKDTKGGVDVKDGRGDGKVMCIITNPSGTRTDSFLRPLTDGTYKISYTPFEEGRVLAELDGVDGLDGLMDRNCEFYLYVCVCVSVCFILT